MSERKSFFGSAASKWLLAGAVVASIGATASFAEWERGVPGGPGGFHGHHRMGPEAKIRHMCENDPLKYEGVARAYLKADLGLNANQNAELDKLAGSLVPSLKVLRDEVCSNFGKKEDLNTPDRFDKFSIVLRKAAETAEKSAAPIKAFYSTLDDKQKKRLDELVENRHKFHHGMKDDGGRGDRGDDNKPMRKGDKE